MFNFSTIDILFVDVFLCSCIIFVLINYTEPLVCLFKNSNTKCAVIGSIN